MIYYLFVEPGPLAEAIPGTNVFRYITFRTAWGLITALSRLTANGWGAYPELLLRTTHFVVPFVLLKYRKTIP